MGGMGYELAVKALVVSMVLGVAAAGVVEPSKTKTMRLRQVPAMYVFGDSTLDVGMQQQLPAREGGSPGRQALLRHRFAGIRQAHRKVQQRLQHRRLRWYVRLISSFF